MKRAFLVILLATIIPIACFTAHGSGETGITLDPQEEQHIAAGARFDVAVVDTCSDAKSALRGEGQGKIPTAVVIDIGVQTCEFSSVESIDRAQSSDEAVLTVDGTAAFDQYGIITLLAHQEGVANVSTEIATSTGVYPSFLRGAGDLRAVLVRPDGRVVVGGSNGLFELR